MVERRGFVEVMARSVVAGSRGSAGTSAVVNRLGYGKAHSGSALYGTDDI